MENLAIYYDSSKCTACKGCQIACKTWNNLPSIVEEDAFTGSYQNPPDINGETRLVMTFSESEGGPKGLQWIFSRRSCQHCSDAACVDICPTGCLYHHESGMVAIDTNKCIGCQFCSTACPYDVPRYHGEKGVINKCDGCASRIENGLDPACVHTCHPGALQFGERSEMLEMAYQAVEKLHERGYTDAVVYGDDEMGGLHVVQVLKYGIKAHDQVENPEVSPVTALTGIMKPITGVAAGVTVAGLAGMAALAAGYKRKTLAYNPETEDTLDVETGTVIKHGNGQDEETVGEHIKEAITGFKGGKNE